MTRITVFIFALLLWTQAYAQTMGSSGAGAGFIPTCTQSSNFIVRTTGASSAQQKAWNTFICRGVNFAGAGGSWWSAMDAVYLLATGSPQNAVLNLVSSSYTAATVNSPTFQPDAGLLPSNNGYLDTNLNPSSAGGNYTLNAAHISACLAQIGGNSTVWGYSAVDAYPGFLPQTSFYPSIGGNVLGNINNTSGTASVPNSFGTTSGFWVINRTDSATVQFNRDGTQFASVTQAAASIPNIDLNIGGRFGTGSPPPLETGYGGTIEAMTAGGALTTAQITDMNVAINAYMIAVGAVPCNGGAPTAAVTSPMNGDVLMGTSVTLTGSATDNVGILYTNFLVDGVSVCGQITPLPFSCVWNSATVLDGSHTITMSTTDLLGLSATSSAVSFTTNNGTQTPTVAVTVPSPGAMLSGTMATLTATASDGPAGVTSVQLEVDGAIVCTFTTAPYTCSWNTVPWIDGSHTVTAVASNINGSTTSSSVSITTSNGTSAVVAYIAATGNDTNPCTMISPCLTAQHVAATYTFGQDGYLYMNGGDTFTMCQLLWSAANVANTNVAHPFTMTSYGTGQANLTSTCTGANAPFDALVEAGTSGVAISNLNIRGTGDGLVQHGILVRNLSGACYSGILIENNDIGGMTSKTSNINYSAEIMFEADNSAAGCLQDAQVLNNTLHGVSGVASTDYDGMMQQGNGANIKDTLGQGNLIYNLGGTPACGVVCSFALTTNAGGQNTSGVLGTMYRANLAHDIGANANNCGGPASLEAYTTDYFFLEKNEVYYDRPVKTVSATGIMGAITGGSGYVAGTYTNVPLTGAPAGTLATVVVGAGGNVTSVTPTYFGMFTSVVNGTTISNTYLGGSGSGYTAYIYGVVVRSAAGSGYTTGTYTGVAVQGGSGSGMVATVVVAAGTISSITITTPGTLYGPNDVLTFNAADIGGTGSGFSTFVFLGNSIGSGCDWDGTDCDGYVTNCTEQYNYVHDNFGNNFLFWAAGTWGPAIIRYNISENGLADQKTDYSLGADSFQTHGGGSKTVSIYNNTEWAGTIGTGVCTFSWSGGAGTSTGVFANNIVRNGVYYACGQGTGITPAITFLTNNWNPTGGSWYQFPSTYASLAAWEAASGDTGSFQTTPGLAGTGGTGGICTWTPSSQDGPQAVGCPSVYELAHLSANCGVGTDLTASPYFRNVGTQDYYNGTIPYSGSTYNVGAFGTACP